jgi:hypothetical protein
MDFISINIVAIVIFALAWLHLFSATSMATLWHKLTRHSCSHSLDTFVNAPNAAC